MDQCCSKFVTNACSDFSPNVWRQQQCSYCFSCLRCHNDTKYVGVEQNLENQEQEQQYETSTDVHCWKRMSWERISFGDQEDHTYNARCRESDRKCSHLEFSPLPDKTLTISQQIYGGDIYEVDEAIQNGEVTSICLSGSGICGYECDRLLEVMKKHVHKIKSLSIKLETNISTKQWETLGTVLQMENGIECLIIKSYIPTTNSNSNLARDILLSPSLKSVTVGRYLQTCVIRYLTMNRSIRNLILNSFLAEHSQNLLAQQLRKDISRFGLKSITLKFITLSPKLSKALYSSRELRELICSVRNRCKIEEFSAIMDAVTYAYLPLALCGLICEFQGLDVDITCW